MKKGLVLEGGAMRGMFTAGILDVFMEEGIEFDGCVGTSAGAVFGCNLKSRQPGRALRYNTTYSRDPRYFSIRNVIFTGDLYGKKFCYDDIPNRLDPFDTETFAKHPMNFYICCTNVETGRAFYHKCNDGGPHDLEWMRASASMPLVSKIVEIDGMKMLDGGSADSIPIKYLESKGYDKNIVILTQPDDYRKKPNSLLPVIKLFYRNYPGMYHSMRRRHIVYNETLDYLHLSEKEGKTLVLRPKKSLGIGRTERNPDELRRVHAIGKELAYEKLDEIREFLGISVQEPAN